VRTVFSVGSGIVRLTPARPFPIQEALPTECAVVTRKSSLGPAPPMLWPWTNSGRNIGLQGIAVNSFLRSTKVLRRLIQAPHPPSLGRHVPDRRSKRHRTSGSWPRHDGHNVPVVTRPTVCIPRSLQPPITRIVPSAGAPVGPQAAAPSLARPLALRRIREGCLRSRALRAVDYGDTLCVQVPPTKD